MTEPKILLLTITGDRWETFRLVMKWIEQQEDVCGRWLILNDGEQEYNVPAGIGGFQAIQVKTTPCSEEDWGITSQVNQYLKAVEFIREYLTPDVIVMIGDDDYYKPRYVRDAVNRLDGYQIAGPTRAMLIHPGHGIKILKNKNHSAMESTAIRTGPALDLFEDAINKVRKEYPKKKYIDMELYRIALKKKIKVNLYEYPDDDYLMIALKGHPCGRPGITGSHRNIDGFKRCRLTRYIRENDLIEIMKVWRHGEFHNRSHLCREQA